MWKLAVTRKQIKEQHIYTYKHAHHVIINPIEMIYKMYSRGLSYSNLVVKTCASTARGVSSILAGELRSQYAIRYG